jgi:paraquat-inducible protein B
MAESTSATSGTLREPRMQPKQHRTPIVWVVPIIAIAIGLGLLIHARLQQGPTIVIAFDSASGLQAGKTFIKYKEVVVGAVTAVELSDDDNRVLATVEFQRNAQRLLHADTRFWIVRPQIGPGGVSGIDTLLSGAYIAVDPGTSTKAKKSYVALDNPPIVTTGEQGRSFVLKTDDLNSLHVGSPLYFRHIDVGRVTDYSMDAAARTLSVRVFVRAPYDQFVSAATRFWNASGVDVSLTSGGLKMRTQSLATIVSGGVAFDNTPDVADVTEVAQDTVFPLATDQETAMSDRQGTPLFFRLRFPEALRGLEKGASVEFFGVAVGDVRNVVLDYDPSTRKFSVVVDIAVYEHRLGPVLAKFPSSQGNEAQVAAFVGSMVKDGLRAQARTGNLLTGQLYISLDFVPHAPPVAFDEQHRPLMIPTTPGSLSQLQEQLADIVAKVHNVPFDSIGRGVNDDIAELGTTLRLINTQTLPSAHATLGQAAATFQSANGMLQPNAALQTNLNQMLTELTRLSYSLRSLSDLLNEHPESLIRGRPGASSSQPASGNQSPEGNHP